jgi:hypothetical protein
MPVCPEKQCETLPDIENVQIKTMLRRWRRPVEQYGKRGNQGELPPRKAGREK